MQTFLPYPDFAQSAATLDRQRLGKQRVETLQLLKAMNGESKGWVNHPATNLWRGYQNALVLYGVAMCQEWISRGYQDTCLDKIKAYWQDGVGLVLPPWLGRDDIHASHRSNLLRKDAEYYGRLKWAEPNNLPYIWE